MTKNKVVEITGEDVDVKAIQDILKTSHSKSEKMRQLYQLELDVPDIAKLLDTSYNFVYNVIARKYGEVRTKGRGESKSQKFRDLWDQGLTIGEIAKTTNENYNQVWQVVDAYRKQLEVETETPTK